MARKRGLAARLLILFTPLMLSTPVFAEDIPYCHLSSDEITPKILSSAKALAAQNYPQFFEIAGSIAVDWSGANVSLQEQLKSTFPSEFLNCHQLLADNSQKFLSRAVS